MGRHIDIGWLLATSPLLKLGYWWWWLLEWLLWWIGIPLDLVSLERLLRIKILI